MSYYYIHCRQMKTSKGYPAANQFIISNLGTVYFQSYNTTIAKVEYKEDRSLVTLDKHWNNSRKTMEYLNKFLKETIYHVGNFDAKLIEKYIKNGTFGIEDLNELPF